MTEAIDASKLFNEIRSLREDVSFIKKHMFDPDSIMTEEEAKRFKESMKELKEGKTISLKKVEEELG